MVDLLHIYGQSGVGVFARLRESNKVRAGFNPAAGCAR